MSFLTETNLETSIDAARGYRRTSGNKRSKEAASATSGVGLPSASDCKDPMYQEVLSLSSAPERCSGALCLLILMEHFPIGTYPSSRGENKQLLVAAASQRGSSPLTRGKQTHERDPVLFNGLIPAHAGKTVRWARHGDTRAAHPRSRGENATLTAGAGMKIGSSPLTRGKPSWWAGELARRGLIPAHAGKT